MIEYKDLRIEDNKLFYYSLDTGYSVEQDKEHSHMYWIRFSNGNRSKQCYTLTTACDNLKVYYIEKINATLRLEQPTEAQGSPAHAFK